MSKEFLYGEWVSNKEKTLILMDKNLKKAIENKSIIDLLGKMTYRFDKTFTSFADKHEASENRIQFKYIVTNENSDSITIKYNPEFFFIYGNEISFIKKETNCIGVININSSIKFTEIFCK